MILMIRNFSQKKKSLFSILLSAAMILSMTIFTGMPAYADDTADTQSGGSAAFTDVSADAWYHDCVQFCVERDYMNGTSDTIFSPGSNLSRAMAVTVLWRMDGCPEVNYAMSFSDVAADQWYTEAIRWAQSEGIVTGYSDTTFGTNDSVTRQQLASILYRYAESMGQGFTGASMFYFNPADSGDISDWAMEAMRWCYMEDILKGDGSGALRPLDNVTRAETASMLEKFCEAAGIEESSGMANPWTETDAAGILSVCGVEFGIPEEADQITYQVFKSEKMGEMDFVLSSGAECCARVQPTSELEDISGAYFDWQGTEECLVNGTYMGTIASAKDEGKDIQICNWYDDDLGLSYSVTVEDTDLNGFDIQAVAEQLCPVVQAPVITDLSSYEAIISQLKSGQAYAFADIDKDHDALLVTNYIYDNLDGNMAAIEATVYGYDSYD